jgi:hypothetical protein
MKELKGIISEWVWDKINHYEHLEEFFDTISAEELFDDFHMEVNPFSIEMNNLLISEAGLKLDWWHPAEYSSPVLTPNISTFSEMRKFLLRSKRIMWFDENCGFHVHLSFPASGAIDLFWFLCKAAISEDLVSALSDMGKYEFYHEKFAQDILDDLLFEIESGDVDKIASFLIGMYKNKQINVHVSKHGTIEWRGPRGFLNGEDEEVTNFIKHLHKTIMLMSRALSGVEEIQLVDPDGPGVLRKRDLEKAIKEKLNDFSDIDSKIKKRAITEGYTVQQFRFGFELEGLVRGAKNYMSAMVMIHETMKDLPLISGGEFSEEISLTKSDFQNYLLDSERFFDWVKDLSLGTFTPT